MRPNRLNEVEADKDFERCGNPMKPNIAEMKDRARDGRMTIAEAYDLCLEVERQTEEIERLREALKNARGALRFIPSDTVGYNGVLSVINSALRRDTQ